MSGVEVHRPSLKEEPQLGRIGKYGRLLRRLLPLDRDAVAGDRVRVHFQVIEGTRRRSPTTVAATALGFALKTPAVTVAICGRRLGQTMVAIIAPPKAGTI